MEHKIIQGGEQFLPFARSRIKALRAAGLAYASQKFEIDGVSIEVRIAGEHEYIQISGGANELEMDSGVVDILSIAPLNPSTLLPGVLFETPSVALHNASFVLPTPDSKLRIKSSGDGSGQIVGRLRYSSRFAGAVPIDGVAARSFSPRTLINRNTTPPSVEFSANDDYLSAKKNLAVMCPASIFTGKCRLYVQAIYGSPMYFGKDGSQAMQQLPKIESSTTAAPVLWFDLTDKELGDYRVKLSTSSGVHLDNSTGEHWLFCPATDSKIYAYPLKATTAAEKLRRFLKASNLLPQKDILSEEDKEHLEAFILSQSTPRLSGRQVMSGTMGEVYSMGYGWHWNWDGLTADAVINSTVMQDGINTGMVSSHFRLSFSRMDNGSWHVNQYAVEADAVWSVYRSAWVITEPDFSNFTLKKTTPKNTIVSTCNAPFYAYYVRNTLKVCRVIVTYSDSHSSYYETPGWTIPGTSTGNTVGLRGGISESSDSGGSFKLVVSVGDRATYSVPYGVSTSKSTIEITNKSLNGFGSGFGGGTYGVRTFYEGYPDNLIATVLSSYVADNRMPGNVTYDYVSTSSSEIEAGVAVVVIPLYDSEACYVYSNVTKTTHSHETKYQYQSYLLGSTFVRKDIASNIDGVIGADREFVYYGWDGATASAGHVLNSTTTRSYDTNSTLSNEHLLHSRDMVVDADFGSISPFTDNSLDTVDAAFYSLSSTQVSDKSTIYGAPPRNVGVGMPSNLSSPVIVGWI